VDVEEIEEERRRAQEPERGERASRARRIVDGDEAREQDETEPELEGAVGQAAR
jgi:hypothetical protein